MGKYRTSEILREWAIGEKERAACSVSIDSIVCFGQNPIHTTLGRYSVFISIFFSILFGFFLSFTFYFILSKIRV